MLVLTRKQHESIVINDVIKITVVEIRGDKVRLGIDAPREIDVHRQEVYEQLARDGLVRSQQETKPAPEPPKDVPAPPTPPPAEGETSAA